MPEVATAHMLLVVFALGAALCAGWWSTSAVLAWLASHIKHGAAVLGALLLVVVAVLLIGGL